MDIKVTSIIEDEHGVTDNEYVKVQPFQVIVVDGADPRAHADGRIGLVLETFHKAGDAQQIGVSVNYVKTGPLKSEPVLSTNAMDALARRLNPNARVVTSGYTINRDRMIRLYSVS